VLLKAVAVGAVRLAATGDGGASAFVVKCG
jgi:hypothetical protein